VTGRSQYIQGACQSNASPASAWAVWTNPRDWTGDAIQAAKIDGEFAIGARITIKAKGLPTIRLTVTGVEPQSRWTRVSKPPGLTMTFEHITEQADAGTVLIERANLHGPLAAMAARLPRNRLKVTFDGNTAHCARVAERHGSA
jgi:hypothetical protein